MDKKQIFVLIAALYALDISARAAAVKDAAKENNIAVGDLFKALKEAGYNPKAEKGAEAPVFTETPGGGASSTADTDKPPAPGTPNLQPKPGAKAETVSVTVRHKTEYPKYRRAGLVLSQKPEVHEVTASQLAALKSDKWVEVIEKEGGKK
jgi:hypothetical protein